MGDEEFLDALEADNRAGNGEEPKAPEPTPEPAKAEEPKAEPEAKGPERDEGGRFKAKEEAPATPPAQPQPAEPVAVQPTPQPEAQQAPVTALIDERLKRQRAEDDARRANEELQRLRAAQQPQPEAPDPDRDPVGFAQFQQNEFQKLLLNERLNVSERFARKEHGAETLEAAKGWAKEKFASDPLYRQQIFADADPYDRLVTDYRRDQLFSQVSDPKEIDEFRAWKAAQAQLAQPNTAVATGLASTVTGVQAHPSSQPSPIPPPSLASAPSAGNVLQQPVQSDEEMFAETFPRK